MQSITIRGSVVRFFGGLSILAALALSTGVAAANPTPIGVFECGPSECATATRDISHLDGERFRGYAGKYAPSILDESVVATTTSRGTGGRFGPSLLP